MTKKKNNTFKFTGFRERLEAIRVDTIFLKRNKTFGEVESYFLEKLEEWSDLNGTLHFDHFKKSIPRSNLQTYAQLLHYQNAIVDAIIDHLNVEDSLCLPALLDLSIGAYLDLQQDFKPHFWKFFGTVQNILLKATSANDVDLLEKCFTFFAHLFRNKHSSGQLVPIFEHFLPLIAHKRDYIRRFACESISYLIRKHKDFDSFLTICFEKVESKDATNESMAELIYQAMKSVKKTLNTSAIQFYQNLLERCSISSNFEAPSYLICVALTRKVISNVKPEDLNTLFDALLSATSKNLNNFESDDLAVINLMDIWLIWAENSRLTLLFDHSSNVFNTILIPTVENLKLDSDSTLLLERFLNLFKIFLAKSNSNFPSIRSNSCRLIESLLSKFAQNYQDNHKNQSSLDILFKFLNDFIVSGDFDHYWPILERHFENLMQSDYIRFRIAEFYCRLCDDKSLNEPENVVVSSSKQFGFSNNGLRFKNSTNLHKFVVTFLNDWTNLAKNRSAFCSALFLLPEFSKIDPKLVADLIENVVNECSARENSNDNLILCLILLLRATKMSKLQVDPNLKLDRIFEFLKKNSSDLQSLNALHWFIDVCPALTENYLPKIDALVLLQNNLLSPFQEIRVRTLKILSSYHWAPCQEENLFDLALECELIKLDLQSYREKIRCYTKLSGSEYEKHVPTTEDKNFKSVTLKFLLGQLNVNFTLLTPILHKMIESHARSQISADFWEIFGQILNLAHENVSISLKCYEQNEKSAISVERSENNDFYSNLVGKLSKIDGLDDQDEAEGRMASNFVNFRLLIWKTMENFADLAQSKSRFLSELILNLAEVELCLTTKSFRTENLTISNVNNDIKDETSVDNYKSAILNRQLMTLVSCLTVYSKFSDIKNVAKEKQLKLLYFELLMQGRPDVQKVALDCILAYKLKSLEPYSSHLCGLLIDKQFKDELVLFNIDSEVNMLQAEHRSDVTPILLRLLYGRLLGKGTNEERKKQIYRFLASCQSDELTAFLDFLFFPLKDYLSSDEDIGVVCKRISTSFDLAHSISFRKIKGVLAHLSTVIKQLSYVLGNDYRTKLLRLCCILGSIFGKIHSEKETIRPHFAKTIKKLRNDLILRLAEFFEHFESYPFKPLEIECLFDYCLSHVFEKSSTNEFTLLSNDIVKLCNVWSNVSRFFPLLAANDPRKSDKTLLHLLIGCLDDANLPAKFRDSVCLVVYNLIITTDFIPDTQSSETGESTGPVLIVPHNFAIKMTETEKLDCDDSLLNFGTKIILPYADILLNYIARRCSSTNNKGNSNKKTPPVVCRSEKWTKILTVLTESAPRNAVNSAKLLRILFDVVKSRSIKNPAIESDLIRSIDSLLQSSDDKESFLSDVAELFLVMSNRQSRENLLNLFQKLSKEVACLAPISEIIADLNSWNTKRIEEPNYDKRIGAFSILNKTFKSERENETQIGLDKLSDIQCWLISNNCLYTVINVNDMALRDNAGYTSRLLVEYLRTNFDDNESRAFLTLKILPCVQNNLKSREEAVRHEFMNILGSCVKFFPEHPKLIGLLALSDMHDQELNFFENVTHIQLHRRCRAIRRLCDKLENASTNGIKVPSEVLLTFVWPVCYSFIFDPTYVKNSTLIDESVRFLGFYCSRAPWKRYNSMLKYYLQRLRKDVDRQKLLVKIIAAILDAFHFDIKENVEQTSIPANLKNESTVNDVINDQTLPTPTLSEAKRKIFEIINNQFVPQLQNCLVKKTSTDVAHKIMKKAVYDEDEEILRVPLALALVKLLQKLGDKYLQMNLSNILAKICQMLKSRSWDIREATRKILCRTAECLGAQYLPYIVKEMKQVLTRGYQLHVLTYTTNVLLDAVMEKLVAGDLNPCLEELIAICNDDLFGEVSDQKEVDEITKKLKEAKAKKTLATYKILGRFISGHKLDSVLSHLKKILDEKFSHKTVTKVNDVLKHFAQGMINNKALDAEFLMIFVHKILKENVSKMNAPVNTVKIFEVEDPEQETQNSTENKGRRPASCLLIDPAPPRVGASLNASKRSRTPGLHVLVIFACEILDNLLKNGSNLTKIDQDIAKYCAMLDPFLEILLECLSAKQTKVVAVSMRCINHMIKYPLPSWEKSCDQLLPQLFVLLSRFAGLGSACKGENNELLSVLFKTVTLIVRDLECATLNVEQLKILLTYIEEDLYDSQKQSTAFGLLKAILHRKLSCPEIKKLIQQLEKLVVESQTATIREQSRNVIKFYMQNYPGGKSAKTVDRTLRFFCAQLQYEYETGRDSALDMLNLIIHEIDEKVALSFCDLALFLFVHLASMLINDESHKLRKKAAVVIKSLLSKIDQTTQNSIIQMIFEWLNGKELIHQKLAAHLLGLVADDKMDASVVQKALNDSLNVLESMSIQYKLLDDHETNKKSIIDHVIYLLFVFYEKLFTEQPSSLRDQNFRPAVNRIWGAVIKFLDHPHLWVQHLSCRLVGLFFGRYKPEELASSCVVQSLPSTSQEQPIIIVDKEYLLDNPRPIIKTLCLSFIQRLRIAECNENMAEQIIKNMVFLGRCVRLISKDKDVNDLSEDVDKSYRASLKWLTVQMSRICRFEVAQHKEQILRRNNIFKWFASLIVDCDNDELDNLLPAFLRNLHREMTLTLEPDETLKQLSSEIVELVKSKIGVERFIVFWSKAQTASSEKRLERKQKIALEAVVDPEKASKRKIQKHKSQQESKKRKSAAFRNMTDGKSVKRVKKD